MSCWKSIDGGATCPPSGDAHPYGPHLIFSPALSSGSARNTSFTLFPYTTLFRSRACSRFSTTAC